MNKYKDLNGKEIVVDMQKSIFNITDDLASEGNSVFKGTNSEENNSIEPIKTQIVDACGNAFSITDGENSIDDITDIDVYLEASHSDTKINDGYYTADSMLRDFTSYIHPYNKPFLKNHDSYSEPLGRIVSADCTDSVNLQGTKAVTVVAKVTDKDAMNKFMDGRYNTVSIGANPGTITCQHCGKQILKDGKFNFCGHWRGETYDGKLCTWKFEDLDYSELSVVNKPADKFAQVYKIVVNRKSDKKAQDSQTENPLGVNDGEKKPNIVSDIAGYEEPKEEPITNDGDDKAPTTEDGENTEPNAVEDNKDQIDLLNSKVEKLNNLMATSQTQIQNLEEEVKNLKEENDILNIDNSLMSKNLDKISDMYISDLVSIINLGKEEPICSKETPFKDLKEQIKNFISEYENRKSDNNQSGGLNNPSSSEDKNPTSVKPIANPGLNNSNDKYSEDEVNDEEADEENSIYNSFDNTVDLLIK